MSGHIASVSFGKDSAAMILRLINEGWPLDEVVFYDTGMEFDAIYNVRDAIRPMIEAAGIKYTELKPPEPFLYMMLAKPIRSKEKGFHYGYGWCGGLCRWGTKLKTQAIDAHTKDANVYIGIAADEPERLARLPEHKRSPLAEWGMTERDCLDYCRAHGISWQDGDIDLYDVLDRVSCWCCCNKNKKELQAIYEYLPQYWERLRALQVRLSDRPMKHYHNRALGDYGSVFDLEKIYSREDI